MGTAISSLKAAAGRQEDDESILTADHGEEMDEGERPAKRIRTEPPGHQDAHNIRRPFGQMTNESRSSSRPVPNPGTIDPAKFYGKTKSRLPQHATPQTHYGRRMKDLIPKPPVDFHSALKIDFLGIHCSRDMETDNSILSRLQQIPGRSTDIKCKCAVSIFCTTGESFDVRCRHVKRYILRLSIDQDGDVEREFLTTLGSPFVFSSKDFCITRENHRRPGCNGRQRPVSGLEPVPDLADDYRIQILIEPDGYSKYWPPFDIPPPGLPQNLHNNSSTSPRPISKLVGDELVKEWQLSLYCTASKVLEPGRQERPARLALYHEEEKQPTDYCLDLDIRWSQPNTLGSHTTKGSNVEPHSAAPAPKPLLNQSVPESPLKRKADEMIISESPANRSRRSRATVATYNLKALSAQAQGRSPKKQQQQLQHPVGELSATTENGNGLIVLYSFGKADAADARIRTSNDVPGLSCPFCYCPNRTLDQLRLHLCNEHTNFRFSLRRKEPPRITFFVEVLKNRPAHNSDSQRTFQLTKSNTLFDLEKYLNGDNSWVKKRQGLQHNVKAENNMSYLAIPSQSSSPPHSRQSSPNTSEAFDDITFLEPRKAASPVRLVARLPKTVKVPKTTRSLYHTISKKPLVPGQDLSSSDDEKDEVWYHQKHRDIINDFSDLNADEMEFINRWNPFITKKQQSVRNFLHRAIAEFAEENKQWLTEKSSRRREFVLNCQACIMRGDLSEDQFAACLDVLEGEKRNMSSAMDPEIEAEHPTSVRGEFDCACGKLASIAQGLTCRGKPSNNCPGRFYHRECAENSGRNTRGKWLCDHCFALEQTA